MTTTDPPVLSPVLAVEGRGVRQRHLDALDGVRAVAAYAVIATHAGFASGSSLRTGPFAHVLARLTFGVTLFFLLSGFLLYSPFAVAAIDGTPAPAPVRFWWRRFLRIAPAYWLAIGVTVSCLSVTRTRLSDWWSYLTLTQTYTGHTYDPAINQMWTLTIEVSFYAALPLVALAGRRVASRLARGDRLAGQVGLIAVLAVASLAWDLAVCARSGPNSRGMLWLPAYLDWFGLGMLLAVAACRPAGDRVWRRTLWQWAQFPGTCWIGGALLYWLSTLPVAGPRDLSATTTWQWLGQHYLFGAAAFFFLLPVVLGGDGWHRRLLGGRSARWFGEISYGVYLWHLGLLLALQRWFGWLTFSGHFLVLFVLTAVGATAIAAVSWHLLERPLLQRYGLRWRRPVDRAGH